MELTNRQIYRIVDKGYTTTLEDFTKSQSKAKLNDNYRGIFVHPLL